MSFLSYLIFAIFLTLTYGQNFDDYFEVEDTQSSTNNAELTISATSPPMTSTSTSPQPITSTSTSPMTSTSTSPQPITSTSTSPQPITSTSTSLQPTTSTLTSPQPTTSTSSPQPTTPTPLVSTATAPTCSCDEKINPNLISLVKEMIVSICEKKIETTTTTTRTTTEATTTTTDKMDRFFEDVFSEFEENIKVSKPSKRSKPPADLEGLLIVTLSSVGAGITVLILVSLFLCLKKDRPTKSDLKICEEEVNTGGNQENLELVPKMMAVPEDVCFADEDDEEITTETPNTTATTVETEQPISVSKIKEGFIRKCPPKGAKCGDQPKGLIGGVKVFY